MVQPHSDLRMVPLLEPSCPIWIGDISWTFPKGPAATVITSLIKRVVRCADVFNNCLNYHIKYHVVNMVFACMGLCTLYLILCNSFIAIQCYNMKLVLISRSCASASLPVL